jgi:hypothetical protein
MIACAAAPAAGQLDREFGERDMFGGGGHLSFRRPAGTA